MPFVWFALLLLPTGNGFPVVGHVLPPGESLGAIHVPTPMEGSSQSWAAK
jgi:hypothetical protein